MEDEAEWLGKEIRRLASQERRQRKLEGEIISPWCLQVALVIACMTNYEFEKAYTWLRCPKRRGRALPEAISKETLMKLLEEKFMQADLEVLLSYMDDENCLLQRNVKNTAAVYVAELKATENIFTRNWQHGAVVDTEELDLSLLDDSTRLTSPYSTSNPNALDELTETAMKKKRNRFRKKFGVTVSGVMYTEKPMSQAEKQTKATHPWIPIFGPKPKGRGEGAFWARF